MKETLSNMSCFLQKHFFSIPFFPFIFNSQNFFSSSCIFPFFKKKKSDKITNHLSSAVGNIHHCTQQSLSSFRNQNQKLQLPSFFLSLFFHLHIYIYTHTYIYIPNTTRIKIHTFTFHSLYNLLILFYPFSLSSNFLTSLS